MSIPAMLMTECAKELFGPLRRSSPFTSTTDTLSPSRATASSLHLHSVPASTSQVSQRLLSRCRATCAPCTLSLATCRGLGQSDQQRRLAIGDAPWLFMYVCVFLRGYVNYVLIRLAAAPLAVNIELVRVIYIVVCPVILQRDAEGISARHPKEVTRMALARRTWGDNLKEKKELGRYVSLEVGTRPVNPSFLTLSAV